jgi:hypothetical protein
MENRAFVLPIILFLLLVRNTLLVCLARVHRYGEGKGASEPDISLLQVSGSPNAVGDPLFLHPTAR